MKLRQHLVQCSTDLKSTQSNLVEMLKPKDKVFSWSTERKNLRAGMLRGAVKVIVMIPLIR